MWHRKTADAIYVELAEVNDLAFVDDVLALVFGFCSSDASVQELGNLRFCPGQLLIVSFPISVNFPFLGQPEIRLQYSVF